MQQTTKLSKIPFEIFDELRSPYWVTFSLLAVFILVLIAVVLVFILVGILVVVLGTVAVLVIHSFLPSSKKFAGIRYNSIPNDSGFILRFEKDASEQPAKNSSCNTTCCCL